MICDKFASEGCNIAINYNSSKDAADKLGEEIKSKHGVKVISLAGVSAVQSLSREYQPLRRQQDMESAEAVKKAVQDTVSAFGGIDIIIANAGWTRFGDFQDLSSLEDEEWDKVRSSRAATITHSPARYRIMSVHVLQY